MPGHVMQHWDTAPPDAPWKALFAFLAVPLLGGGPYAYRRESDLHLTLAGVLQAAMIPLRHEVWIAPGKKIDFVSRGIGIEVKTLGGYTDFDTGKQLLRYSSTGTVKAILLVTTCWDHLRGPHNPASYDVPVAAVHIRALRDRPLSARSRSFK